MRDDKLIITSHLFNIWVWQSLTRQATKWLCKKRLRNFTEDYSSCFTSQSSSFLLGIKHSKSLSIFLVLFVSPSPYLQSINIFAFLNEWTSSRGEIWDYRLAEWESAKAIKKHIKPPRLWFFSIIEAAHVWQTRSIRAVASSNFLWNKSKIK